MMNRINSLPSYISLHFHTYIYSSTNLRLKLIEFNKPLLGKTIVIDRVFTIE
jgi:hypothetical protein